MRLSNRRNTWVAIFLASALTTTAAFGSSATSKPPRSTPTPAATGTALKQIPPGRLIIGPRAGRLSLLERKNIGLYDSTPIATIIRRNRARAVGPRLKMGIFPGFFTVGGLPPAGSIAAWSEEVAALWNGGAQGQTRFSYEVAEPTQITATPGTCNQLWAGDAVAAHQAIAGDKNIFYQEYDPNCRYGGEATLGGSSAFVNNTGSPLTGAHEIGHTIGENHTRWGEPEPGGVVGDFERYRIYEYGGRRSVMAGGDKVTARHRIDQGWLYPIQAGRAAGRFHLQDIERAQNALMVQRDDGHVYLLELRETGVDVFSSYFGEMQVAADLQPGALFDDPIGGVRFRVEADGWIAYDPYQPAPRPTPDPRATPTPAPTFGTGGTPEPTPCFVSFLRCTPVPTATVVSIESTPTPSPTSPPATETPLPAPTIVVDENTPTPTPSSTPEPTTIHPPAATTPVQTGPGPIKGHGGCGFGMALAGDGGALGGLFLFFRRRRRGR